MSNTVMDSVARQLVNQKNKVYPHLVMHSSMPGVITFIVDVNAFPKR